MSAPWWFLARFAATFGGLRYAWGALCPGYAACAAQVGNWLLPASSRAALSFRVPAGEPGSPEDLPLVLTARSLSSAININVPIDLYSLAYIPTACLISLALATPVWNSRRGPLLLATALTLLTGFLLGSLAAPLVLFFASREPLQLIELSASAERALDILYRALVAPPGMTYAVPALFWLATVSFMPGGGSRPVEPLPAQRLSERGAACGP
jgi:hypothetical protein